MTLAVSKFEKTCNIKWNLQYEKLVDYKRKNGDCRVPRGYEQDKSLGPWVNKQRTYHTRNKMRQDRKDLLDELEFTWSVDSAVGNADSLAGRRFVDDKKWHQHYEKLVEFKRKNGHSIVPQCYDQDKSLGQWVNRQRKFHYNNKMRPDRKDLLDTLEFAWKADSGRVTSRPLNDKKWHQHYVNLVEFKRKNGDCRVPRGYDEDKSLRQWVNRQRRFQCDNNMHQDRKDLLDDLEFAWMSVDSTDVGNADGHVAVRPSDDKKWHQHYERLVEFQRKNGDCIVPQRYEQDKFLGRWVERQRGRHNTNKLRKDRKKLLKKLGFIWNVEDHEWYLQYEKVVAFKRQHEHCRVPFMYKEDASLCYWVDAQRKHYRKNKIRPDRKSLLVALEFVWEADTLAARPSSTTNDVRGLIIGSSHALGQVVFLILLPFCA
jgi:hypothetical protein